MLGQVLEDALQLVGVAGGEVLAAGRVGHGAQGVLVDDEEVAPTGCRFRSCPGPVRRTGHRRAVHGCRPSASAGSSRSRSGRRAPPGRQPGRRPPPGVDAARVGAVGEQHDDLGRGLPPPPGRGSRGCRAVPGCPGRPPGTPGHRAGGAGVGGGDVGVDLGDRVDRLQDGGADRRAASGRQAVDGLVELLVVGGRCDRDLREPREDHEPDARPVVLLVDEGADGVLGGREPVGTDVRRAHRARHVDREDHRRARDGYLGPDLGAGRGGAERREGREDERDRHVSSPHPLSRQRGADQGDAGERTPPGAFVAAAATRRRSPAAAPSRGR